MQIFIAAATTWEANKKAAPNGFMIPIELPTAVMMITPAVGKRQKIFCLLFGLSPKNNMAAAIPITGENAITVPAKVALL